MLPAFFTKKRPAAHKNAKKALIETLKAGREAVDAKKAQLLKAQEQVSTAVGETMRMASDVMTQLARVKDEGVLFIDYKGNVLHANQVAYKVLGVSPAEKLIGKSIESLLSAKPRARRHVAACSQAVFDKIKALAEPTMPNVVSACSAFNMTQVSGTEVALNEPVALAVGDVKLQVRLSLLETAPEAVEDVTYLCKLSRL